MTQPLAWSFSVLESHETCPWRHYLTKVTKEVSDPPGPGMARGREVHKAFEHRVRDKVPLPGSLIAHEPIVQRLEQLGGKMEAEIQMALDQNYRPVPWFGKGSNAPWVRCATDVTVIKGDKAFVGDWKTGKRKEGSAQLALCSAVMFTVHPFLNEVRNSFIWLDEPNPALRFTTEVHRREQKAEIWQTFLPRVARLENAHAQQQWPKRPSGLCRAHCPVPRAKCEHSGA